MQQFEILDETPQDVEEDRSSPAKIGGEDAKFKDQKGRYKGEIDPVSKLRTGTGTYTYTNSFFQY